MCVPGARCQVYIFRSFSPRDFILTIPLCENLIYLMLYGKCALRALLGQSPAEGPAGQNSPNKCHYWWSLSLAVSAPKQLFRFMLVYAYKAAHMSHTIFRHCQCSCQVQVFLYNKCIVHTNAYKFKLNYDSIYD